MRIPYRFGWLALMVASASYLTVSAWAASSHSEALAGGETTVFDETRDAFSRPARNLREEHRADFFVGNSFFNQNWITPPASVATRDGLGPLFNARSCSGCHFKDGRGRPPEEGEAATTLLLRISLPGTGLRGAATPDATYGDQIQGEAIAGIPREADALVHYTVSSGVFGDGTSYLLRKPVYRIETLGYGPISPDLLVSPRVSPAIIGLGLLEAIPADTLHRLADPDDIDADGISGRLNKVWNVVTGRMDTGRFGWKAEQPSVVQQSAGAFIGDIGITSALFPQENHTRGQEAAARQPSGGRPELDEKTLHAVAIYARTLAVPASRGLERPQAVRGRQLFADARCSACHVPMLVTGGYRELPELAHQTIRPYTDLLLHDVGSGLADERPVFEASGREWRTPPLWGVGLIEKVNGHTLLLHDGRARNVAEAILWHDGEARAARETFRSMPAADRDALVAFVNSL